MDATTTTTDDVLEGAAAVEEALRTPTTSTALARADDVDAGEGFRRAEEVFTEADRRSIAAFLNVTEDDPAFMPLLATAAQLGLNPLLGEIWLIPVRMKVRDAEGKSQWEDRYRVAVGRDGLLKCGRRTRGLVGGYRGLSYGVVCARDTFEVQWTGDLEHDPKVLHRYATKPTHFGEAEDPQRYRGRIIGAWAKLHLVEEPAHFYFAHLREHGQTVTNDRGETSWKGAWGYTSGMTLKAAQSYVLRLGLGVTGIVPVDEMGNPSRLTEDRTRAAEAESFDWDEAVGDEELRGRLRRAVEIANAQDPGSWLPAKLEMVLGGRSDEELRVLAEGIEVENAEREAAAARAAGESTGGEPADADVVADGDPSDDEAAPPDAGQAHTADHHVEALRLRERQLVERLPTAQSDREEAELSDELDRVRGELRGLLGDTPGQSSLDA